MSSICIFRRHDTSVAELKDYTNAILNKHTSFILAPSDSFGLLLILTLYQPY